MNYKIAIDAMGGDHAPHEIIAGSLHVALHNPDVHMVLVGQPDAIAPYLPVPLPNNVSVVSASEVIEMSEAPVPAVRSKPNSSINVGLHLVKRKAADAFVSAGNTGAAMAAALFVLGRIEGVDRPAILGVMPARTGRVVILDLGANVDCKPRHLVQFAQMGSLFAKTILNIPKPRVSLLNIGEEPEKGNELTVETHGLLIKQGNVNFIGNIEGTTLYSGITDVVVCDGFNGNIVLKLSEGVVDTILGFIRQGVESSTLAKLGAVLLKPVFSQLKKKIDYDEFGGGLLLGVNGPVVISHGRATRKAITSAIELAVDMLKNKVVDRIRDEIKSHPVAVAEA